MEPKLVINFKTYQKATSEKTINILKAAEDIETNVDIIICPQFTDIRMLAQKTDLNVFSQHVDSITPGSNTGHILPMALKEAGAKGTLINHSEKPMTLKEIEKANRLAKKRNLKTIICVNNSENVAAVSQLNPNYVAIEPPELIGGDISVTKADPGIIKKAVEKSDVPVLCGAGVSSSKDFRKALELGSEGVLVASAIAKAKNPKSAIQELIENIE